MIKEQLPPEAVLLTSADDDLVRRLREALKRPGAGKIRADELLPLALEALEARRQMAARMAESAMRVQTFVGRILELEREIEDTRRLEADTDAKWARARDLLDWVATAPGHIEEATVPQAGIDAAPHQVVCVINVNLVKMREIRALLGRDQESDHADAKKVDQPT